MTTVATFTWDGLNARDVSARLGMSNVWMYAEVESTQDIAHGLAEKGVPAGALVVADAQRSGRGRQGKSWSSPPGQGVWCTMVERPRDSRAFAVLSLRVGMRLASALDEFAGQSVLLKWPNDLVIPSTSPVIPRTSSVIPSTSPVIPSTSPVIPSTSSVIPSTSPVIPSTSSVIPSTSPVIPSEARDLHFAKLAGILTEARWNGSSLAWVAVGVGVNVTHPRVPGAAALRPGTTRIDVLRAIVSAVREAAAVQGLLTPDETERFRERDALAGKRVVAPGIGVVQGIDASGALLVRRDAGLTAYRSGMVQLESGS